MLNNAQVILVDLNDNPIGTAEKLKAHRENLCHRAFSVFIFRKKPQLEVLLQQRAANKYHSPNLWTNTCCSHPYPGEDIIAAGQRRLQEEMGIVVDLTSLGSFHYIAHFDNGLSENEVDHVLIGYLENETIKPNPNEVQDYRWINLDNLQKELRADPKKFTPWLEMALSLAVEKLKNSF